MRMRSAGAKVLDLGSDFRLDTPQRYEAAYGSPHPHPEQLGEWAYGLPELFADELAGADRILFGTDYPLIKPGRYFDEIAKAGLTEIETVQICGLNAKSLLGLYMKTVFYGIHEKMRFFRKG